MAAVLAFISARTFSAFLTILSAWAARRLLVFLISCWVSWVRARRALFWAATALSSWPTACSFSLAILAAGAARSPSDLLASALRSLLSLENSPSAQATVFFRFSLARVASDLMAYRISFFISARASLVWRFSSVIWEWMLLESLEISVVIRRFMVA